MDSDLKVGTYVPAFYFLGKILSYYMCLEVGNPPPPITDFRLPDLKIFILTPFFRLAGLFFIRDCQFFPRHATITENLRKEIITDSAYLEELYKKYDI